jgi:hypothetical protein
MPVDIDAPHDTEIKQRIIENANSESAYNESHLYTFYLCSYFVSYNDEKYFVQQQTTLRTKKPTARNKQPSLLETTVT